MLTTVILTLSHLLVAWLPLVAALWGMVLVASHQEWGTIGNWCERRPSPRLPVVLLVVEKHGAEIVRPHMWCQELIMRHYETC